MSTFSNFTFRQEYEGIAELGDRLGELSSLIDWNRFRPIIIGLYQDNEIQGGRPHTDEILLLKMLILQQWHGLSDYELEKQCLDRISFRHFLGYPLKIPDRSTIWHFRERLAKTGAHEAIWKEHQDQIDAKGLIIKRGVIQDATYISADPGHAPVDKSRGNDAKTRRVRDGTWAKKGIKSSFGYKLHILIDKEHQLIRRFKTTSASTHDNRVDLSKSGETVYRDKGYFGTDPQASMDKTMHRGVRDHPLSIQEKRRNRAIMKVRSLVERPFAVIKRTFHADQVYVTTCQRTHVKSLFSCFAFNLHQLLTLSRCSE